MDVLNRIQKLKDDRGWSNYRLAIEAGITQGTLNNMFRLNNLPTLSTLEAICRAFGITLSQFFSPNDEVIDFTPDQSEILYYWSTMTNKQKNALLMFIKTIL